jgi:hypothetical protein
MHGVAAAAAGLSHGDFRFVVQVFDDGGFIVWDTMTAT